MTRVAILIPGIMGSELHLGKKVIWPGNPLELKLPYRKMEDLMKDDLVPKDIIRRVSFSVQYESLIEDLERCGCLEKSEPPTLYVFPYDWRQSNLKAAAKLAKKVDDAFDEHHGQAEISLVAHSMGGLIGRFYLESGLYNNRKGFTAVRQLLSLGTPHRGAPLALTAVLGKERRLFLNKEQVRKLVSDPRFPSLYELLPPDGEPFAWDEGPTAAYKPLSIYDPEVASGLGLVPENLLAAQTFHRQLSLSRRPEGVRYFFFVGSRQVTASSVYLFSNASGYEIRKEEPEDAGDGTVPIWSATLTGVQGRPVGGEHGTIYQNKSLRRTLAALMGSPGMLAAAGIPTVEVSVRDKVVEPGEPVHIALSFSREVHHIRGNLNYERVEVDKAGRETATNLYGPTQRMQYSGVAADKIGLVLVAPDMPGFYRVRFKLLGRSTAQGTDDLFVQGTIVKEKGRKIPESQAQRQRKDHRRGTSRPRRGR